MNNKVDVWKQGEKTQPVINNSEEQKKEESEWKRKRLDEIIRDKTLTPAQISEKCKGVVYDEEAREEVRKAKIIQRKEEEIKADAKHKSFVLYFVIFSVAVIVFTLCIKLYGVIVSIIGATAFALLSTIIWAIHKASDPNFVISPQNPHMECPHCKTVGQINTRKVDLTKGISGGKAVAGLLTGGLSILAVGISREETKTEARCGKCNNVWHF